MLDMEKLMQIKTYICTFILNFLVFKVRFQKNVNFPALISWFRLYSVKAKGA